MTALQFADTHNLVAFLSKPVESDGFEQIATIKVKTVNGEVQLQALVDRKKIIVTEASVRRDLQLNNEEVDALGLLRFDTYQQKRSQNLYHEDLEQIHEDDLEEMDLKWQLALLSIRTRKFFQKMVQKITINGSDTAGYEKLKVECFNIHKLGHFARECRRTGNQEETGA
ncbi:ribonuclease H-like domain-containing protein [Tanacetum coccineum]